MIPFESYLYIYDGANTPVRFDFDIDATLDIKLYIYTGHSATPHLILDGTADGKELTFTLDADDFNAFTAYRFELRRAGEAPQVRGPIKYETAWTTGNIPATQIIPVSKLPGQYVNATYVSLVNGQLPPNYTIGTGEPRGMYPLESGGLQLVVWEAPGWKNYGNPFFSFRWIVDLFADSVANIAALTANVEAISEAQNGGLIGYTDKAAMDTDTSQATGAVAIVTNDATAANNGYYRWDGSTWVKRDDFYANTLDPDDTGDAVTGKAVADFTGTPSFAKTVEKWIRSESYVVTGTNTISSGGVTLPQNIVWPNGVSGTLANLVVSDGNITSLRFNYGGTTKFIVMNVDYSGAFPRQTFTSSGL